MTTDRENELLKMIRRLENALITEHAIANRLGVNGGMFGAGPIDAAEMDNAESDLMGDDLTVGRTVLEASRILRKNFDDK